MFAYAAGFIHVQRDWIKIRKVGYKSSSAAYPPAFSCLAYGCNLHFVSEWFQCLHLDLNIFVFSFAELDRWHRDTKLTYMPGDSSLGGYVRWDASCHFTTRHVAWKDLIIYSGVCLKSKASSHHVGGFTRSIEMGEKLANVFNASAPRMTLDDLFVRMCLMRNAMMLQWLSLEREKK